MTARDFSPDTGELINKKQSGLLAIRPALTGGLIKAEYITKATGYTNRLLGAADPCAEGLQLGLHYAVSGKVP